MSKRLSAMYFLVVVLILLCYTAAVTLLLHLDYNTLVTAIVHNMHKNGLEQKIRNNLFPQQRYLLLRKACVAAFPLFLIAAYVIIRYRIPIQRRLVFTRIALAGYYQSARRLLRLSSAIEKISLVVIFMAIISFHTWRLLVQYPTYDEMWSYNYYTASPFYYSFFTYSSYPLFEWTTHLFKQLPFAMITNLRLSPFLFGLAACLALFISLRRYFDHPLPAFVGLISFAFMPLTISFMVNARGVMHGLFFSIVSIFSLLFWLHKPADKRHLVIYIISGILGMYAMATLALLIILLWIAGTWLLRKEAAGSGWQLFKANLLMLLGFLLLYAPIFVVTGSSIYRDVATQLPSFRQALLDFPTGIYHVLMDYSGYSFLNVLAYLLAVVLLYVARKKFDPPRRGLLLVAISTPLFLALFYLLSRFNFAGRSLAWGALSIPLTCSLLAQLFSPYYFRQKTSAIYISACTILLAVFMVNGYRSIPARPVYKTMAVIADTFLANHIQTCYDNASPASGFYYFYPGLEYYYRLRRQPIALTLSAVNSMRYKPLLPTDHYDSIVYDADIPASARRTGYHEMFRDPLGKFIIYKKDGLR